ncbi:MAG: rod shape-determining protein MreC [Victivallaceae bacterium]
MFYKQKIKRDQRKYLFVIGICLSIIIGVGGVFEGKIRNFIQEKRIFFLRKIFSTPITSSKTISPVAYDEENFLLRRDLDHLKREYAGLCHFFLSDHISAKFQRNIATAKVVYRDPSFWNSSFWIDIGQKNGFDLKKNSPVVSGGFLVGLVDYVGDNQSRVRMITDAGIKPSVYVPGKRYRDALMKTCVSFLIRHLQNISDYDTHSLVKELTLLNDEWDVDFSLKEDSVIFGVLNGTGNPLRTKYSRLLKGHGFCQGKNDNGLSLSKGDILVTTGFDGVFPEGIPVAEVVTVIMPQEGDYILELEAQPLVKDLDLLNEVIVLPPVNFNSDDFPDILGASIK